MTSGFAKFRGCIFRALNTNQKLKRFSGVTETNTYMWWLKSRSAYNRPVNKQTNVPPKTNIRLL